MYTYTTTKTLATAAAMTTSSNVPGSATGCFAASGALCQSIVRASSVGAVRIASLAL